MTPYFSTYAFAHGNSDRAAQIASHRPSRRDSGRGRKAVPPRSPHRASWTKPPRMRCCRLPYRRLLLTACTIIATTPRYDNPSRETACRVARLDEGAALPRVRRHVPFPVGFAIGSRVALPVSRAIWFPIGFRLGSRAVPVAVGRAALLAAGRAAVRAAIARRVGGRDGGLIDLEHADRFPSVDVTPERADGRVGRRGD